MKKYSETDAPITEDGKYRYYLTRVWDYKKPTLLFIMLNPSIADSNNDDPTIRRVVDFAEYWGYGGIYVGNLYAFRSTDPKGLLKTDDPKGPENEKNIKKIICKTEKVVYAWGHKKKEPEWLKELVETPYCIDVSKKGNIPKHPGRLNKQLQLKKYIR
jgi:hypothetical protein